MTLSQHGETPLAIIGAGPFGIALSGYANARGLEHVLLGDSMAFWKHNMPAGMLLRSGCDWHLDPNGVLTMDAHLAEQGLICDDVRPVPVARYLEYVDWFMQRAGVSSLREFVQSLDRADDGFVLTLNNGERIVAGRVVVAIGFGYFANEPSELTDLLPAGSFAHTCVANDIERYRGRRVLIVGGRQSAFEWAALLNEAGAREIHLTYRHATPSFETSDWSWIPHALAEMKEDAAWYRRQSAQQKEAIGARMFAEGRLKLEPWLPDRISSVQLWPNTRIVSSTRHDEAVHVVLDSGDIVAVDDIILATGYRFDAARIPFLRAGNAWPDLRVDEGFPSLDAGFQSSVPGLYFTSSLATRDFGPFFAFTVSARYSARRIIDTIIGAEKIR